MAATLAEMSRNAMAREARPCRFLAVRIDTTTSDVHISYKKIEA
jgi:hypothetical protein